MFRIYLKFITTMFIIIVFALNLVATNFTRLTGKVIDKPADVVFYKGNIYLAVMSKKTKITRENIAAVVERYGNYIPEKELLFTEVNKWYNMTRNIIEKR